MMLQALERLLGQRLDVVATVTDGQELIESAIQLQPDLVLADISMPGLSGIEAVRRLKAVSPASRVLILSLHEEPERVRSAFEAGAWAYLTKTSAAEEIEGAIQEVLADRFYVSPKVTRSILAPPAPARPASEPSLPAGNPSPEAALLTQRELEIVRLVGQGLANKDIAAHLGVALTTVRTHLNSIYGKLGHESRVELALSSARILAREL